MRPRVLARGLLAVLALGLAACEDGGLAGPSRGATTTQPCLTCPKPPSGTGGTADAATRANEFVTLAFGANTGLVRWETPVRVSVASSSPSDEGVTSQVVGEVANLTFLPMTVVGGGGNVVVKFLTQTGCGPRALGCTSYSLSGPLTSVEVRILAGLPDADRTAVLRHEFGHAMGLTGHSRRTDSLMYPEAAGVSNFSSLDRWALRTLYSPSLQVGITRDSAYAIALELP